MTVKPISWFALWKRLGKQPLSKTRGQYVKCCIVGQMWYCRLVYTNNGSEFYLEPFDKEQKQMKTIITIILSSLITLCVVDFFFDIPYVYGNISGILSGIVALFMINTKSKKE